MSGTGSGIVRAATAEAAKCLARGDIASAEQAASAALNASVERDGEALHMMGLVRFHQHRFDESAMLLARALQAGYRTPELLLHFGSTLSLLGQHAHAATILRDAVTGRPEMTQAWFELGNQQHQLQQLAEAQDSYQRALALEPKHGAARLALGAVLMDMARRSRSDVGAGFAGTASGAPGGRHCL